MGNLGRRAAAALALLTVAAAIAVVVVALLRHPLELPIAVLLLAVAAAMAWSALIHRGLTRLLTAAVAIAALVTITLLPGMRSFVVLATVIGLVALSTAAAKAAFGREHARSHPVGPARHGVLLMNPKSGGGKVTRFGLDEHARRLGVTPIVLGPDDDLRALATRAVTGGADVIGMAGGDGSQALVADVARRHDVAFVCVPAGTRNHFALDLGLDRDDVAAALEAFGAAVERRVDLAQLGDRVFVNNASLGVYATVVQSVDYRDAKLATTAQLLPDLLGPESERLDLSFTTPDGSPAPPADIVLVSNNAYTGLGTRSRLDGGVLGVVAIALPRDHAAWTTPQLDIDSTRPLIDVGLDGEALRLPPPLRFRSLPGALRVRTPVGAPGIAHTGIGALWRVLTRSG